MLIVTMVLQRILVLCLLGSCLAEQPNILFILMDDMGYGDIGEFFNSINAPT